MTFLINNIITIALSIALLIQLIYWIIDKIKTKRAILDAQKEIKELEVSIKSLRKSNHKILNLINELQIKAYCNENVNKIS
jgi:uncharacterized protein YoxC